MTNSDAASMRPLRDGHRSPRSSWLPWRPSCRWWLWSAAPARLSLARFPSPSSSLRSVRLQLGDTLLVLDEWAPGPTPNEPFSTVNEER